MLTNCPRCDGDDVNAPSFTWWGGALGAFFLRHRICNFCRFAFNAKTGASNRRAVLVYVLATNALVAMLIAFAEILSAQQ